MFRAGLYARVSTNDRQTVPLQIRALREYAARRGWTIAVQVKEAGSGASQRQLREKLLDAARRREIDVAYRATQESDCAPAKAKLWIKRAIDTAHQCQREMLRDFGASTNSSTVGTKLGFE